VAVAEAPAVPRVHEAREDELRLLVPVGRQRHVVVLHAGKLAEGPLGENGAEKREDGDGKSDGASHQARLPGGRGFREANTNIVARRGGAGGKTPPRAGRGVSETRSSRAACPCRPPSPRWELRRVRRAISAAGRGSPGRVPGT